jgi:hypothetical protein
VLNARRRALVAFWRPRVEGQLRDVMFAHPDWFTDKARRNERSIVRSIAKRIIGEIVAEERLKETHRSGIANSAVCEARRGILPRPAGPIRD